MVADIHHNYRIVVNDQDVTASVRKHFISLELTDNDKDNADELVLVTSKKFKRPDYNDKIKVFLGWGENLTFAGLFYVQSTKITDNKQLTINATGVNFSGDLKQRRFQTYIDMTLGDVVWEIAVRHDLEVRTNIDVGSRFEQANESDLGFLNRLAREHNAVFNIKNNTLYFMQKGTEVPYISVDINKCITSEITRSNKTLYKSCKAIYHNTKLNKSISVIYGEGSPQLVKQGKWLNDDDAMTEAKNALIRANKGQAKGNLKMKGHVCFSGSKLELDNEHYEVTKVFHYISDGWETALDFDNFSN